MIFIILGKTVLHKTYAGAVEQRDMSDVPIYERFLAGHRTVRGYKERSLNAVRDFALVSALPRT